MAKPNSGSVTSEPQLFYLLQCTEFHGGSLDFSLCGLVTEQTRGVNNILLLKGPPLSLWGSPPPTRFSLPATRGKMSLNARDW